MGLSNAPGSSKIEEVLRFVETQYVDSVDREMLIQTAIDAMLAKLDPHSVYIPSEDLNSMNEQLEGNLQGIGIKFTLLRDTILILKVVAGGPAEAAGLKAADRIVSVNDSTIVGEGLSNETVMKLLRGETGTTVSLGIKRAANPKLLNLKVIRGEIPIYSIESKYMLDATTGYIHIARFSNRTYEEFMSALDSLIEKHNMKDLVIDLRDNPGGYLVAATRILDQLFDKKELLVYTEGRASGRKEYNSKGQSYYKGRIGQIVVLINENSASASEIMAAALQDHDRAILVGRRTFGKGLVQEPFNLSDGSALRLTIARYYTPSGRSIQKPYVEGEDYESDMEDRMKSGELKSRDSLKIQDTTKYYTSNGRVVYGGGGVIPDIFIPVDAIIDNSFYLHARGWVSNFSYDYWDRYKQTLLKQYPDYASFNKNFTLPPAAYQSFVAFAKSKLGDKISFTDADIAAANAELALYIKAVLASALYGEAVYEQLLNEQDDMIKTALRVFKDKAFRDKAMK